MHKKILLLLAVLTSTSFKKAYALVDYSESVPERGKAQSVKRVEKAEGSNARAFSWKADYSFATNYETMEIDHQKTGLLNMGAHVQTPANIFFDLFYWTAAGRSGTSNGNPKFIIGFNWLRIGNPSEEARFDIYGGAKLKTNSELGSSRTDKIVGVETTKRFGTFGLGIGYDMTIVGAPANLQEKSIGNIGRLAVSGGWMVSNDIQFEVEVENFTINKASSGPENNRLNEKVNFSTISPKLNLGLSSAINLELGARFRMKKVNPSVDLSSAKVFDLHGVHSNSLFAGINVTI